MTVLGPGPCGGSALAGRGRSAASPASGPILHISPIASHIRPRQIVVVAATCTPLCAGCRNHTHAFVQVATTMHTASRPASAAAARTSQGSSRPRTLSARAGAGARGGLPARGFLEAGLPDGAVDQADGRRELA